MIPARVKQIAKGTALLGSVVFLCFLGVDRGAGIVFGATTLWMLGNLLVWSVLMKLTLQPDSTKNATGIALAAIFAKLTLLFGGILALRAFAPYDRLQVWAIVAGVSSVLFVAVLKAAGARIVAASNHKNPAASKKQVAKV